ncbi:MAG: hypothetical protein ACK4L7_00425 [Flavobacteriales bacterium]
MQRARERGLLEDPVFRRECMALAFWAIGGSWWRNAGKPHKALPWIIRAALLRPGTVLRKLLGR